MFHLFLFSVDETATILSSPVLSLTERPTEITAEMLSQIILNVKVEEFSPGVTAEFLEGKSFDELLEVLNEDLCLYLPNIAVVEGDEAMKAAETAGDAPGVAMQHAGSDSAIYSICEAWSDVLQEDAIEVFDIGRYDD